jgi:hypothetical protein
VNTNGKTEGGEVTPPKHPSRFEFRTPRKFGERPLRQWIVKNLIQEKTLALIYGPSNQGKTQFMVDLMQRVVSGLPFFGRKVMRGAVGYIAAEGSEGLEDRIEASQTILGVLGEEPGIYLLGEPVDLTSDEEVEELINALRNLRSRLTIPLLALVVDTLAWCSGNSDENQKRDAQIVLRSASRIKMELGITVLFVHHSGKDPDAGPRGSTATPAGVDTMIEVKQVGNRPQIVAKVVKQRDGKKGDQFSFEILGIILGTDEDGEPYTAPAIRECGDFAGRPANDDLSEKQQLTLDALSKAGAMGLTESEWRDAAKQAGVVRQTFRDHMAILLERGFVVERDARFYVANNDNGERDSMEELSG